MPIWICGRIQKRGDTWGAANDAQTRSLGDIAQASEGLAEIATELQTEINRIRVE